MRTKTPEINFFEVTIDQKMKMVWPQGFFYQEGLVLKDEKLEVEIETAIGNVCLENRVAAGAPSLCNLIIKAYLKLLVHFMETVGITLYLKAIPYPYKNKQISNTYQCIRFRSFGRHLISTTCKKNATSTASLSPSRYHTRRAKLTRNAA